MLFKVVRLVISCVILAIGVAMLLIVALGSDGYSTMFNGLSIALGVEFFVVNFVVGVLLVAMAWARGLKPGLGTIVQPVVVGFVVSGLLDAFAESDDLWARAVLLLLSFPILAVGVAGYLATGTGAGPAEEAAFAAGFFVRDGRSAGSPKHLNLSETGCPRLNCIDWCSPSAVQPASRRWCG